MMVVRGIVTIELAHKLKTKKLTTKTLRAQRKTKNLRVLCVFVVKNEFISL